MSEKRRPSLIIVARKPGKAWRRVELFPANLWPDRYGKDNKRFRIRVNGIWWKGEPITRSKLFEKLRKEL